MNSKDILSDGLSDKPQGPKDSQDVELDDELAGLFSAFDDIRASDQLKSATLERILADTSPNADDVKTEAAHTETAKARWPKNSMRSRIRSFKLVAIAACLAFALAGGTAYALPSAHVQVGTGSSSIGLDVNCFGIAISASSDDSTVDERLSQTGLDNRPAAEAIDKAIGILDELEPTQPIEVTVLSSRADQRKGLEDEAERLVRQHTEAESSTAQSAEPPTTNNDLGSHEEQNSEERNHPAATGQDDSQPAASKPYVERESEPSDGRGSQDAQDAHDARDAQDAQDAHDAPSSTTAAPASTAPDTKQSEDSSPRAPAPTAEPAPTAFGENPRSSPEWTGAGIQEKNPRS